MKRAIQWSVVILCLSFSACFICGVITSSRAEERLHAYITICKALGAYVEKTEGQWPESQAEFLAFCEQDKDLNVESVKRALKFYHINWGGTLCSKKTALDEVHLISGPSYSLEHRGVWLDAAIAEWKEKLECE